MGEGRRRRGSRVGRVGPRALDTVCVGVIFLVRMRTGHVLRDGISRERRKTTATAMMPRTKQGMRVVMVGMGVVRMVAARTILEAIMLITLHLRSRCGKQVDVHARRCPVTVATIRP